MCLKYFAKEAGKLLVVDPAEVALHMSELIADNRLCVEDFHGMTLVYPRYLYYAEKRVAERLLLLKDRAKRRQMMILQGLLLDGKASQASPWSAAQHEAGIILVGTWCTCVDRRTGTGRLLLYGECWPC